VREKKGGKKDKKMNGRKEERMNGGKRDVVGWTTGI
jgi:hypothetical protein